MTDRFDLEQQILECWRITEDIKLFCDQESTSEDFGALATVYDKKFNQLWATFETMCKERQFREPDPPQL